jgi:signal transduction histidine kinase
MQSVKSSWTESQAEPSNDEQFAVIDYLQHAQEQERTALARTLHDDLGGLLVAAVMDVGWAEQHLTSVDELRDRLSRVRQALAAAIDLKRSLTEVARPSLLDNFGLFAALRWHLKHSCERAGIAYTERYPVDEPAFRPEALTGLFRIIQETLALTFAETKAFQHIDLSVAIENDVLLMEIVHEHAASDLGYADHADPIEMTPIRHRVHALGGQLRLERRLMGGTISVQFPVGLLRMADFK